MRHISFDESTVLNEFAKIAHKDGLVKTAAEPTEEAKRMFQDPAVIKPQSPEGIDISPPSAEATLNKLDEETGRKYDLVGLLRAKYDMTNPKHMQALQEKLTILLKAYRYYKADPQGVGLALQQIRKNVLNVPAPKKPVMGDEHSVIRRYKVYREALQRATQLFDQASKNVTAGVDQDMTKEAKGEGDKYYDVTGETGEQLVEKAHPGGGTRTELTHSKTDENLVETIVEQQKVDIDVARSVPKGTYAALVSLYGDLVRMGHKKHLGDLKTVINSIATTDEIIDYTLTTLADRLDDMGLEKYADTVDDLKKKV
jgi:hypothetical protein